MYICRQPYISFSFFLRFFLFFSEQDGYEVKVAFVSNRFENILEGTVFSTAFNSKHKLRLLNLSQMTKQFFNIGITIFIRLTSSMEEDFFSQITTLKTVPSDEKSNCCTCAEECQMPFKVSQIITFSPIHMLFAALFWAVWYGDH